MSGYWTQTTPGAGDTSGIRDLAVWLSRTCDTLTGCATDTGTCATTIATTWTGQAATAWTARTDQLSTTMADLTNPFRTGANALMAYVDHVGDIAARAAQASADITTAQHTLTVAQARADTARSVHLHLPHTATLSTTTTLSLAAPAFGVEESATALHAAARQVATAQDDLSAAQARLTALADERRAADCAVTGALAQVSPAGWNPGTARLLAGAPVGYSTTSAWATAFATWATNLPDDASGRDALRQAVGQLSDEQWTRLLADHPGALGAILTPTDLTGDPVLGTLYTTANATTGSTQERTAAVAAAFAALAVADQAKATRVYPWLIGNLDGAPYKARDKANRAVLTITIADVEKDLAQAKDQLREDGLHITGQADSGLARADLTALSELQRRLDMLNAVNAQLSSDAPAGAPKQLVVLDTTMTPLGADNPNGGKAAIAIGDLDTAANVGVLVPGLSSFVTNYIGHITPNALRVYRTAVRALDRAHLPGSVATVAWIGYQAPDYTTVASWDAAKDGGARLSSFVWGLQADQATVAGQDPHLTGLAHSYGSVVAGEAASQDNPFDDLVMFGSPGSSVHDRSQILVPDGHLYAAAAQDDFVAGIEHFGTAPTRPEFLSEQLQTDGGYTPLDPSSLPATGHSQYYAAGTESLDNLSSIVAGQYQYLTFATTLPNPTPGPVPTP